MPFRCGDIAIAGRPNAGKSTLLNHLVGQKVSITSRRAQTTRHRVAGILSEDDAQFVFLDTPGLQNTQRNALNRVLNRTATQAAKDADVVLFLVEAGGWRDGDDTALRLVTGAKQLILVVTKCDLVKDRQKLMTFLASLPEKGNFAAIVPVSVKEPRSLAALKSAIKALLPEGEPRFDKEDFTDRSERFLAAEFVREKVFRQLGDELPYATSVVIEKYETEGNLRRIAATIVVEKASQRAILIGEKGERLKRIGTDARKDMEATFGSKVYLELWVRVKKGWSDDAALLRQYGYE